MGSLNNDNKEEGTDPVDGTLAWAPYPYIKISSMKLWPCLTYRSWSAAIVQSGFFPNYHHKVYQEEDNAGDAKKRNRTDDSADNNINITQNIRGNDTDSTLAILCCKKRVKLSDLANNRVPLRVALNQGKSDNDSISTTNSISSISSGRTLSSKQRRPKVVVHFLGVNEWYVSSITDLIPYTTETAITFLKDFRTKHSAYYEDKVIREKSKNMKNKSGSNATNNAEDEKRTNEDMDDWREKWLLAMKEASIACERQESLNPSALVLRVNDKNYSTSAGSLPPRHHNTKTVPNDKLFMQIEKQGGPIDLQKDVTEEKKELHETSQNDCTPECFDDWRVGGNTQKLSGTSQSQFLLTSQGKTQ